MKSTNSASDVDQSVHSVFVSYAREDIDTAVSLASGLVTLKHECWIDIHDLVPGTKWLDDVEDAILRSDLIVVLLSDASLKSSNCDAEIKLATELGKKIVPVRIGELNETQSPLYERIEGIHWIVPAPAQHVGETVEQVVQSIGADAPRNRQLRDLLLLSRRWETSPTAAVLLADRALEAAETYAAEVPSIAPQHLTSLLAYLNACRSADRQRKRTRTIVLTAACILIASAALVALFQWRRAVRRERDNQASLLAAEANATLREPWLFTGWAFNTRRAALFLMNAMSMKANHRFLESGVELGRMLRPIQERFTIPIRVCTASLSENRRFIAIGGWEGEIALYDTSDQSFDVVARIANPIYSISTDANGQRFALIDSEGSAFLVNNQDGKGQVEKLPVGSGWRIGVDWSRNRYIIAHGDNGLTTGSFERASKLSKISTSGRVNRVAVDSQNGNIVAVTEDGKLLTFEPGKPESLSLKPFDQPLTEIGFEPARKTGWVGGSKGLMKFTGETTKTISLPVSFGVTAMSVNDDGSLLAAASWDGAIHLLDPKSDKEVGRLPIPVRENSPGDLRTPTRKIDLLFFSQSGTLNALVEDKHFEWTLTERYPRHRLRCEDTIESVVVDDPHVWVRCGSSTMHYFHVEGDSPAWQTVKISLPGKIEWLVTSGQRATAGVAGKTLELIATADSILTNDITDQFVLRTQLRGSGHRIAGLIEDEKTLGIWDSRLRTTTYLRSTGERITTLAIASNGNVVVSCDNTGACIKQHLLKTSNDVKFKLPRPVAELYMDDLGRKIVLKDDEDNWWLWTTDNRIVKLSEVPNPTFAAGFVLEGRRFYFSSDQVYVYDTETGQRIGILPHRGETQAGVASFNEGSQILTIGFEGVGRLWDSQDLVELARFAMPDYYPFGLFGLKGGRFVTYGNHYKVEVWDLSEAWLAKTLCAGTIGTLEVEDLRRVGLPPEGANICGTSFNLQP